MNAFQRFFQQIRDFFLCFLKTECPYSLKKLLCYIFTAIAVWMILSQHLEQLVEVLGFIAVLLGIRSYEAVQQQKIDERLQAKKIDENKG